MKQRRSSNPKLVSLPVSTDALKLHLIYSSRFLPLAACLQTQTNTVKCVVVYEELDFLIVQPGKVIEVTYGVIRHGSQE